MVWSEVGEAFERESIGIGIISGVKLSAPLWRSTPR